MKQWHDLSVTYRAGMPEAAGHEKISLEGRVSGLSGSHITQINMNSHSGTHLDAPCHYYAPPVVFLHFFQNAQGCINNFWPDSVAFCNCNPVNAHISPALVVPLSRTQFPQAVSLLSP